MTLKHFDEMPEENLTKVIETVKSALNGLIQGIEAAGYCPCCFCHLVAQIATETANDMTEIPGEEAHNVTGTSYQNH